VQNAELYTVILSTVFPVVKTWAPCVFDGFVVNAMHQLCDMQMISFRSDITRIGQLITLCVCVCLCVDMDNGRVVH